MEQPSLGQLVWSVRRELEWARAQDQSHPVRFDVDTVELDVEVEMSQATSGGGGLNLTVMGVGAKADVSGEAGQAGTTTVHLVLKPSDLRSPSGRLQVGADRQAPPLLDIDPNSQPDRGSPESERLPR